jgi:glycerophosphoryl diester phosphodiesterase
VTGQTGSARRTLRLAHRGDWRHAPENSLAAMQAALAVPACDGLEFDVQRSADGVLILLHDDTLARVQGRPERPDELTATQLAEEGIPPLAEVLAIAPRSAFLDIELKGDPGPDIVPVIAAARGPDLHNAAISSFETEPLERVRRLAPTWPCWLNVVDLGPAEIGQAVELGCTGIAALWRRIDGRSIGRARDAGLDVVAWTVRRRPTFDRLARLGIAAACVEGTALDGP